MKNILKLILFFIPLICFGQKQITVQQWHQDLDYFSQQLQKWHADPFNKIDSKLFQHKISQLKKDLLQMDRHQIVVELMKITALIGDSHTKLSFSENPETGFRFYPIRFYEFSDGIYVIQVQEKFKHVLAKRVTMIGGIQNLVILLLTSSQIFLFQMELR